MTFLGVVIYNQKVTWTASAILAMFLIEWIFFQIMRYNFHFSTESSSPFNVSLFQVSWMEATQGNTTMISTIDPDLFVRPDGLPIVFVLEDALSPKWSLVKEQVEEGGGVLLPEPPSQAAESTWVKLASSSLTSTRSTRRSSRLTSQVREKLVFC